MDLNDIDKTKPNQLKQNRFTNIPDNQHNPKDIDSPQINKFKTKRTTDPLNPTYTMETQSRRHVIQMGKIDGNAPKMSKSPTTKRQINNISDIIGSSPKDRGSIPQHRRQELQKPPQRLNMKEDAYGLHSSVDDLKTNQYLNQPGGLAKSRSRGGQHFETYEQPKSKRVITGPSFPSVF